MSKGYMNAKFTLYGTFSVLKLLPKLILNYITFVILQFNLSIFEIYFLWKIQYQEIDIPVEANDQPDNSACYSTVINAAQ